MKTENSTFSLELKIFQVMFCILLFAGFALAVTGLYILTCKPHDLETAVIFAVGFAGWGATMIAAAKSCFPAANGPAAQPKSFNFRSYERELMASHLRNQQVYPRHKPARG